jgi:alpha-glucosidase (family GH31 glycosyl hydrolase)
MNQDYTKENFKFECAPRANPKAIVQGTTYRFTILTSRLIRLEYSQLGKFEDRPSQTVWFRNLKVPEYEQSIRKNKLIIETEHLRLIYNPEKSFSAHSLQIFLKETNQKWRYGQRDWGNLKGTHRTLDGAIGRRRLEKGLMSKRGYSVLNDSKTLVFDDSYWLTPREEKSLDQYFLGYGRDYLACLNDYYRITGKTPLIPRFILGNWWSRYWEYDEVELKELIRTFKQHNIPLSVCIIDMDWHLVKIDKKYGSGWTGYTWNTALFPNPEEMLKWLHDQHLKVSLNLHPAGGIKGHEAMYPEIADFMGVDKETEEPVKFDITNSKFVSGYFDLVHHPLEVQGVDFWWVDWQQGRKTEMKDLDPLWMLNHLHFYDLGRDNLKRPFIFSRWGGNGNHRYPIGFSGDTFCTWKSLAFQPYFTVTASNVGYGWWSHDIGGHMGGYEKSELYTRWVQFGIFSPIMRLHSTKNPYLKREPWRHDLNTLTIVGDAMRLRHKLIPYIYSMAFLNFKQNIPLMRPLYYFNQTDSRAYKYKNQYWFGSEMIISPITSKMNKKVKHNLHKTYLPDGFGPFFNLFTGEFYRGNSMVTRAYRLCDIPVFVKAGGIITLNNDAVRNGSENPENLIFKIFPGRSNEFLLYEDDGNSTNYKEGENYITALNFQWDDTVSFILTHPTEKPYYIPTARRYTLSFESLEDPGVPEIISESEIDYTFDYCEKENRLLVRINSDSFSKVEIRFDQPSIATKSALHDQMERIMEDSTILVLRKRFIHHFFLKKLSISEQSLKRLVRKIRFGI